MMAGAVFTVLPVLSKRRCRAHIEGIMLDSIKG